MGLDNEILKKALSQVLSGKDAHVGPTCALEGIEWEHAGAQRDDMPHTIFQLLNHMIYWQDWTIRWFDGQNPSLPEHASLSWPGDVGPRDQKDWKQAVESFLNGLEELRGRCQEQELFSKREKWSRLEMFNIIASHNSYHLGQLVFARRMVGAWPPPSGGNTW